MEIKTQDAMDIHRDIEDAIKRHSVIEDGNKKND